MARRTRKIISTLMVLMLAFSPAESMYASQEHHCEQPEIAANSAHQHSDEKEDHHAEQLTAGENANCIFCADTQCCCDNSSCSCLVVGSVFLNAVNIFNFTDDFIASSIPFTLEHPAQPDADPLLRPPIA